jgi:hypothetical protein
MAGSWSESNEADRLAVSKLAGTSYEEVSRVVARRMNQPEPLRRIGDTWTLTAPVDAWSLLARRVTPTHLERYRNTVLEVMGEVDPKLELAPGERWLAYFHGKQFKYSSDS